MALQALPELDAQYRVLREGAGLLDAPPRATLMVRGADAADFLQGQLTNDVEALEPGAGCYAALLDRKGRIKADMRVLRFGPDEIWLDLEPEALAVALRHLETYKIGREVELVDVEDQRTLISLIGPDSARISAEPPVAEHAHIEAAAAGVAARVVRTPAGVDLICAAADSEQLRKGLLAAGAAEVSEAAAEILRVESGRPRLGREIGPDTLPAEAAIVDRAISFTKGCYIGQETVARLHYKGKPNRHLRGLRLSAPVEAGEPLLLDGKELGRIGTSCISPALGPIGLAIVRREADPGDVVEAGTSGATATIVSLPFAEQA
jgi:folate-binding protein YgfZ